jgi:hypothetical protein
MTKCILNCLKSPKKHTRGKTQWKTKSSILQSSHIMILNSTKFRGNRTKDVEVGPDRRRLFEICFHFAGHWSSTQEFSTGPSEFLPDLHFLCKIVLKPTNVIPLLLF